MTPVRLLPCPWCGEELTSVSVSEGSTFRWRKVDGCCTDGPEIRHDTMADDQEAAERESYAEAIAAWNTRAPVTIQEAATMSYEHIKVLRSERDQWQGVLEHSPAEYGKEVERKIAALDAAIAALGGVEGERKVLYYAEVHRDWTTLLLPNKAAFAFSRGTGKVYKLPHPDAPFIDIQWGSIRVDHDKACLADSCTHCGRISVATHHSDDVAVDSFAAAMKAKMAKQRAKGYGGWNDHEDCTADLLRERLRAHVVKGDPVDVGNFAMMLFSRGERTYTLSAPPAEGGL